MEVHFGHLGLWEGGVGLDRVRDMREEVMCGAFHSKIREKAD